MRKKIQNNFYPSISSRGKVKLNFVVKDIIGLSYISQKKCRGIKKERLMIVDESWGEGRKNSKGAKTLENYK